MSFIVEQTIGVSYEQTVVHIGVAFVHEKKSESAYGHSFRAEFSHRSGVIHTKCVVGGQDNFRDWLTKHHDILTTQIAVGSRFGRQHRIVKAVTAKIEQAYAQWALDSTREA